MAVACGFKMGGRGATSQAGGNPTVQSVSDKPGDPAHSLLHNMDFTSDALLPWLTVFNAPADGTTSVKNGALCVDVKAGGSASEDAQVRQRELFLLKDREYVLSFKAWASRDTKLSGRVGLAVPPMTNYWTKEVSLGTTPQQFAYKFKMANSEDVAAELALYFGGNLIQGSGPIEVCFDDLVLSDPQHSPKLPPKPVVIPKIRVNQVGYLPNQSKTAVLVTDARTPLDFQILAGGRAVHSGKTVVRSQDIASGDKYHAIDFSSFTTPGKGYVIRIGPESSDPFDIDRSLYKSIMYHAFRYFYLNRSGIEIALPFSRRSDWVRPAGHPKDEAACSAAAQCNYTLDVTGGWYDAGDYGKYVVNGGISAWTLMNYYERTIAVGGNTSAFRDFTDVVPESGNKVADILDEARWEVEFMLRMQVPEGRPNAGMVHHKVHDVDWTGLGFGPHEDTLKRELHPVSTAATLNLAATAAQASRLFKKFDPMFADRCLQAAELAWTAAKMNPGLLAPPDDAKGGGPYDDTDVTDEFYWAAAELWLTTGRVDFKSEVEGSPLDKVANPVDNGLQSWMSWQRVESLGKISMALATTRPAVGNRERYRQQVISSAEQYAKLAQSEGYRVPFAPNKLLEYPWSSNAFIANNALVSALAYDFTKQSKYRDAVVWALDYFFGRNAMGQSYVTGLGDRPLENPHHRFWAHQANPKYPAPPPGALSGGPNSGLQDPYVTAAGLKGCAPQKCFVDHSESWSTNEVAINLNAPFTWILAWTDEQASR